MRKYFGFFALSLVHLLAEGFGWQTISVWTKPFLMPSLAFGAFVDLRPLKPTPFYIITAFAALAFSTAGDVFLQLEKNLKLDLFFYFGLGAFLMAQCMYIRTFTLLGIRPVSKNGLIGYVCYFLLFLAILYPGMPLSLKVPVTIYGAVLTLMAWSAWRSITNFSAVGMMSVVGSILFVLSDSLLAINRFKISIPYAGLCVMITYILAQYFIVQGILAKHRALQATR